MIGLTASLHADEVVAVEAYQPSGSRHGHVEIILSRPHTVPVLHIAGTREERVAVLRLWAEAEGYELHGKGENAEPCIENVADTLTIRPSASDQAILKHATAEVAAANRAMAAEHYSGEAELSERTA